MQTGHVILPDWDREFQNCSPVGHLLREAFPERWVRFHSLPESKRYPETSLEYDELLSRHNNVLAELTVSGNRVVLITTGYSDSPSPSRTYFDLSAIDPSATPWRTVAMHETDEGYKEPTRWHFFASVHGWTAGLFDPLIRLVADDAVANVLIVDERCRWVLHPYDGGMDVILESTRVRDLLRSKYATWLSARDDGL